MLCRGSLRRRDELVQSSVQKSSCRGRVDILGVGFPKWKQKHKETRCKVSCRCVVGLTLCEWLPCRIYSSIVWVHLQHIHGVPVSPKRGLHTYARVHGSSVATLCTMQPAGAIALIEPLLLPQPCPETSNSQCSEGAYRTVPTQSNACSSFCMLSSCRRPPLEKG